MGEFFFLLLALMLAGFAAYPLGDYTGTLIGLSENGKMWVMLAIFFAILIAAGLIWERFQRWRFHGGMRNMTDQAFGALITLSKRFGQPHWLRLPKHVRRGVLRLYVAVTVPWVALFGYRIFDALNHHSYGPVWRYISGYVWSLLLVPIGGPILLFLIVWVLAGFRESALGIKDGPALNAEDAPAEPETDTKPSPLRQTEASPREEPPVGAHPILDQTKARQAEIYAQNLDRALHVALKSETRARAPETFADLLKSTDYCKRGKSLAVCLISPLMCWYDVCELGEYKGSCHVALCEVAFARVAVLRDWIRRSQTSSVSGEMLKGVEQCVAEAFEKDDSEETLAFYKERLRAVAPKAIQLYEKDVSTLSQLAEVFARRLSITDSRGGEIAHLFKEAALEAERLMNSVFAAERLTRAIHPSMTDYYSLIARAVSNLANNTDEAREPLYNQARTALLAQMRGRTPRPSETEIMREHRALAAAIHKVEDEALGESALDLNEVWPVLKARDRPAQFETNAKASPIRETKGSPRETRVSPEVEAIFKKLDRLMDDEKAQIDGWPEPIRSEVLSGADCDEIAGAVGEFGHDPRNPIPVNGPLGEMIYLSNLRTTANQPIMFHRIGSIKRVDIYETVSFDSAVWDVLFLDLYHPRKSRRAPTGYRIADSAERQRLFLGANERVNPFPDQLMEAIAITNERLLGLRMRPPEVRHAIESVNFERPSDHVERLSFFLSLIKLSESRSR